MRSSQQVPDCGAEADRLVTDWLFYARFTGRAALARFGERVFAEVRNKTPGERSVFKLFTFGSWTGPRTRNSPPIGGLFRFFRPADVRRVFMRLTACHAGSGNPGILAVSFGKVTRSCRTSCVPSNR
jgi:hypothetical protein